ncbi:MAG: branched-chain amino acid ABC transporter permease, partial [Actinobacteria bacterium]|nr:branched-chain amino acid ABC transporter permease [Actinomycetota bacterium]
MTLLRHAGAAIGAAVIIGLLSAVISPYRDFQLAEVAVYVVAVAGLTVLIGLSGQISIGHGAFMAIGAYAAALMIGHLGWPLWGVLPASAVIAAAAGAAAGAAAARLRGPY